MRKYTFTLCLPIKRYSLMSLWIKSRWINSFFQTMQYHKYVYLFKICLIFHIIVDCILTHFCFVFISKCNTTIVDFFFKPYYYKWIKTFNIFKPNNIYIYMYIKLFSIYEFVSLQYWYTVILNIRISQCVVYLKFFKERK